MVGARLVSPEAMGAIPLSNEINEIVGTVGVELVRPAGKKALYLTVDTNKFLIKVGDYFARALLAAGINTTTDVLTMLAAHGFETGDGPYKLESAGVLPEPILSNPDLLMWVRVVDDDELELYESEDQAEDLGSEDGKVDFTTQGTVAHTLPPGLPDPAATTTDGYSSLKVERGATKSKGIASNSVLKISAPGKITVHGQHATARLQYWWV